MQGQQAGCCDGDKRGTALDTRKQQVVRESVAMSCGGWKSKTTPNRSSKVSGGSHDECEQDLPNEGMKEKTPGMNTKRVNNVPFGKKNVPSSNHHP